MPLEVKAGILKRQLRTIYNTALDIFPQQGTMQQE